MVRGMTGQFWEQTFIVKGKFLGTALRRGREVQGYVWEPRGDAFFCPYCAELWAIFPVTHRATGKLEHTHCSSVPCEKHDTRWNHIPGAVHWGWYDEYEGIVPDAVIEHDFNQMLKLYPEEK